MIIEYLDEGIGTREFVFITNVKDITIKEHKGEFSFVLEEISRVSTTVRLYCDNGVLISEFLSDWLKKK